MSESFEQFAIVELFGHAQWMEFEYVETAP